MGGFIKKWVLQFYAVLGFSLLVVGFSGVPGDIEQWYVWIAAMVENPIIQEWAEIAAETAQLINEPTIRLAIGGIGLVAIAWPMKRFLRLRYRFKIWWKTKMLETVWVSEVEAVREIRESEWGQMKVPFVRHSRPAFADGMRYLTFARIRTH